MATQQRTAISSRGISLHGISLGHGAATFLGALLLFQVQLLLAKAVLPRFGGAPAVWTSCMLFFQALLVLGYGYAHLATSTLSPRAQGGVHLVLLALALWTLPIAPDAAAAPADGAAPVAEILLFLARTAGLPCFLLCASSPLLQAWAARSGGATYRLYALSNAGSLLALSYPLAVEPWLTTGAQASAWSWAFGVYAVLCAACVQRLWTARAAAPDGAPRLVEPSAEAPALRRRLAWLLLPACASTLLLAVTNQLCQEVAVVPLLWVLPLGLYLLSFVLTFASDRWYRRQWCLPLLVLTLVVLAQAASLGAHVGIRQAVPIYSLGLFVCCVFCHGELAARRPPARHLTSYYLLVAVGGALGAVFVSLLAPLLFRGFDELVFGLLACGLLAAAIVLRDPVYRRPRRGGWHPLVPALVTVVGVIGLFAGARVAMRARPGLRELRDFYGILRIEDLPAADGRGTVRYLTHGGTRHGQQFRHFERRTEPTTYFGRPSGIGLLLDALPPGVPRRVGVIGLGAGILAAYGRAGDTYRFYELSPMVIEVARQEFTFLSDSAATIELVPGDARLSLAREPAQAFDVLVLDAFSSDAIPVHLLTREAFELYERHLAPGGVLALHVTTRHLDLGPLILGHARERDLCAWEVRSALDAEHGLLDARWILLGRDGDWWECPGIRAAGHELVAEPLRPWTDDYSNLLQVAF